MSKQDLIDRLLAANRSDLENVPSVVLEASVLAMDSDFSANEFPDISVAQRRDEPTTYRGPGVGASEMMNDED